jgi:hypothetical protein
LFAELWNGIEKMTAEKALAVENKTQAKEHITMTSDIVTGLVKPSLFLELRANYLDAMGPPIRQLSPSFGEDLGRIEGFNSRSHVGSIKAEDNS